MKALKSAAEAAANWLAAMQNVTAKVQAGAARVTQAPGAAAAANQSGYLAGVAQSAGKWARNVAAVTLQQWQAAVAAKAGNISTGARAAASKQSAAMSKVMGMVANARASLPPRGPKGTNNGRSAAFSDAMHAAAQQG